MTYCYRCTTCGDRFERSFTVTGHCNGLDDVVRDYRAENAGVSGMVQLKRERDMGGREAYRDQFLPTAKDYESPSDPDGSKGIRKWNDEHTPHSSASGAPLRPDVKRKSW